MKNLTIIGWLIIAVSFIATIYFYPQMPEMTASQWNFKGEVTSYMNKALGMFLAPLISVGLFLLSKKLPEIDPMKSNIKKFRKEFEVFIIMLLLFLLYIHSLVILWNIGYRFDMGVMFTPAFSLLFFFIGGLLKKTKRNWFIGIRTPWTMSSDEVWEKTHEMGSLLFKISAIMVLFSVLIPEHALLILIAPVIATIVFLFVYSYFLYRKGPCAEINQIIIS